VNRITSCSWRGGATPLIVPKPFGRTRLPLESFGRLVIVGSLRLATFTVLLTPVNCVWFRALKMSRRISAPMSPRIRIFFESERSMLLIGGACRKSRADSAPVAAGLWRREAGGIDLSVRIAAPTAPGSHVRTTRVRVAVGTGQIRGTDRSPRGMQHCAKRGHIQHKIARDRCLVHFELRGTRRRGVASLQASARNSDARSQSPMAAIRSRRDRMAAVSSSRRRWISAASRSVRNASLPGSRCSRKGAMVSETAKVGRKTPRS
jgi:hypothetical protein